MVVQDDAKCSASSNDLATILKNTMWHERKPMNIKLCRRRDGIRYKKNEVFIDILESVNLLMSASGAKMLYIPFDLSVAIA